MPPITPLGKPLSQQPVPGANIPVQTPSAVRSPGEEPISAFQWVSLARATWNWLIRPLWLLCVKWPAMLILPSSASGGRQDERRRRDDDNARRADWEQRYKSW